MARSSLIYAGVKHHVIALDRRHGTEVWRTVLPIKYKSAAGFVNVVRDADGLFASCAGELFALHPRTGELLWHEPLRGLGTGVVAIATELDDGPNQQAFLTGTAKAAADAAAAAAAT